MDIVSLNFNYNERLSSYASNIFFFESIKLLIIMHSNHYEGLIVENIFTTKEIGPNKWTFTIQILFQKLAQRLYIPIHKNFI
jgi:hypothetical protein